MTESIVDYVREHMDGQLGLPDDIASTDLDQVFSELGLGQQEVAELMALAANAADERILAGTTKPRTIALALFLQGLVIGTSWAQYRRRNG